MSSFYSMFFGNDLSKEEQESCKHAVKTFLENYYGQKIRKKYLKRFQRRYEEECLQQKRDAKKTKLTLSAVTAFARLKSAIQVKKEYLKGKLDSIPKWAEQFFTKQTFISFLKSLPKEIEFPEFEMAELMINFIYYCSAFGLSWSQYLLMFKEGRELLKKTFFQNDLKSVLALLKVVYTVGITKAFDDMFFRQEFYHSFPDLEKYILGPPSDSLVDQVYHKAALFAIGEISFRMFESFLMSAVKRIEN